MIRLSTMVRQTADSDIEADIAYARQLGLDGVDLHLSALSRDPAYLLRIRQQCLRAGLVLGYTGGGSFVGPPEAAAERLEQGRADVDLTAFVGAQVLRVFARYKWPDNKDQQEALWRPMIESFQTLADYAAERGVQLALQNHNNGSFAMTADQVLRILAEVGRDNFSFLMDTGQWLGAIGSHPRGEFDPAIDLYEDYLKPTAPHTTYVRAKIYKIDSGREEWIDYQRVLALLGAVGFNGTIGLVFELGDRNQSSVAQCKKLAVEHLRQVIAAAQ